MGAAIGKLQDELDQKPRCPAIVESGALERQVARKPAIAQDGADGVRATLHHAPDVVGLVINPLRKLHPARREHIVADLLAVEAQFISAQRRDIHRRPRHRLVDRKLLAQIGRGNPRNVVERRRAPGRAAAGGR